MYRSLARGGGVVDCRYIDMYIRRGEGNEDGYVDAVPVLYIADWLVQ